MQNHYNLIYREDERELIPVAEQYGVSRIPYSPLAGGHLSHRGWESGTKRSNTDKTIQNNDVVGGTQQGGGQQGGVQQIEN